MKILTPQEEEEHYHATVIGGLKGGFLGLAAGIAGVYAGQRRFHAIRELTLQMKAFLVTSSGTFSAIVSADKASRAYEFNRDPSRKYRDSASLEIEKLEAQKSSSQRLKDWCSKNRYSLVTASWVASMATAFAIVNRSKYLTRAQKLVQARVYAQGLTLAVLIATAALGVRDAKSGDGRWETIKVPDPNDPSHNNVIEKRVHHEAYAGEDLWKGKIRPRILLALPIFVQENNQFTSDIVAAQERQIEKQKITEKKTNHVSETPSNAPESK